MKKNAELMILSKGGISLEYIDNYMTPFDRDEYRDIFYLMKKEEIESKNRG